MICIYVCLQKLFPSSDLFDFVVGSFDMICDILHIRVMCYNLHRCPELFESTVKQLFALARSKDDRLREFVLLFAPSLLYIYLSSISFGDKKVCGNSRLELGTLVNLKQRVHFQFLPVIL